jgi:hypothetical protein
MLGEKIYEITAKVTGTRVIPQEGGGVGIEVSFQGVTKLLGAEATEIGSYLSVMRASGSLYGQGQGITVGKQGEVAHWKGFGVGRPTGKGLGAIYRYAVTYETTSEKWARLNGCVLVGEWEVDENGNARGGAWEWK